MDNIKWEPNGKTPTYYEIKGEISCIIISNTYCDECKEITAHVFQPEHDRLACIKCRESEKETYVPLAQILAEGNHLKPVAVIR